MINGSRALHAVWSGVHWFSGKTNIPVDAPSVVPNADGTFSLSWPAATTPPFASVLTSDAALVMVPPANPSDPYIPTPIPNLSTFNAVNVDPDAGMHFCLFNQAWMTNYPSWSMDASDRFRFEFVVTR